MISWAAWAALPRRRGIVGPGPGARSIRHSTMEHYQIHTTAPKGSIGFLHIVKSLRDRKLYAMKMVECMDEATANQAVREALVLMDLQHENICKYKEIFVAWDQEESALSVCMVMDYCAVGDVAMVIQNSKRANEKVREMVIKNFLGQMIDVLVYIHSKNVIHGNLKPSNILLMEDLSFRICDFTVATFINDEVKFKLRKKEKLKTWMSPEALEGHVSMKSDIWSLGCIILEMMTCSKLHEGHFHQLVNSIRSNWKNMDIIMEELQREKYTSNLCHIVQMMMEPHSVNRSTAKAMVERQYIKEALVICGSSLSGKKISPIGMYNVPYGQGVEKLLEYMQVQLESEEAQTTAMKYMAYLLYEPTTLAASAQIIPILISVIKSHPTCLEVQVQVCQALLKFAIKATEDSVEEGMLFSDRVISVILAVMASKRKCLGLQIIICNLLMQLSGSETASVVIGKGKGIQEILLTLRMYIENSHICIYCCSALWSLVTNSESQSVLPSAT
uniref:serine/threonine kinase-like domain-containing protein STKLD1 n=1 Tax=Pristiophorus japonicus TaxID=55135 RepID=UPI00398E6930